MRASEEPDPVFEAIEEFVRDCPYDSSNPLDCPLCELREKSEEERRAFLRALPRESLEQLLVYHWICLESRLMGTETVA